MQYTFRILKDHLLPPRMICIIIQYDCLLRGFQHRFYTYTFYFIHAYFTNALMVIELMYPTGEIYKLHFCNPYLTPCGPPYFQHSEDEKL